MDNPDKEFETFLRQFPLRQHQPFPAESPAKIETSRKGYRWVLASAAALVVALLAIAVVRNFVVQDGPTAMVEIAGDSPYKVGQRVQVGSLIRSGRNESAVLVLGNGLHVEMRAQSELLFQSANDGVRLRLNDGAVLVTASNQAPGKRLYVESGDTVASVTGGEFLFESQPSGKRIAVFGGEVEVQRALTLRKVVPGEQVVIGPSNAPLVSSAIDANSLVAMIAWSRSPAKVAAPPPQPALPPVEAPIRAGTSPRPGPQPQQSPQPQPQPEPQQPPQPEPQRQSETAGNEPGGQILNSACGLCHVVGFINNQHFNSREAYAALVSREVAKGAPVSGAEFPALVDYLFKTYGAK